MSQNGGKSNSSPKKRYEKRILTRNAAKQKRLCYDKYKGLVHAKFKNPLKKLPIYDARLYRKTLVAQENLVSGIRPANPINQRPLGPQDDELDPILLDMRKIYSVEHTMVHFCNDELI